MSEELDFLWRLSQLDERIATARTSLARFPEQRNALETRAAAERRRLEANHKVIGELQLSRRKIEQEIEAVNAQQRQFESRQPSVKTNEEYQALTHEIAGCKSRRSDLETTVLVKFEEEEALAAERARIESALKHAEHELATKRGELDRGEAAEQEALAKLLAARDVELAGLTPATRSRYERVHGTRDSRAVVPIAKNACGGCFRALPPQVLQEARKRERLLVCEGCGRMMLWPPDAA